jgi:hypothetical protein
VSKKHVFAAHARGALDRALRSSYASLSPRPHAVAVFARLVAVVRRRSGLLSPRGAPLVGDVHLGVEALRHLAGCADAWIRPLDGWGGSASTFRVVVHDLASHLLARFPVPRFLGAAWYEAHDEAPAMQRWFVGFGAGRRFRDLDLPVEMSRRMEDLFLRSPDHAPIATALRAAELRGLGLGEHVVDALLATDLAWRLDHGAYWRAAFHFFAHEGRSLSSAQVRAIVDFLDAVRETFSLKGRTASSVLRLVDEWHLGLRKRRNDVWWSPSPYRGMRVAAPRDRERDDAPPVYELRELTSSAALRAETAALRHCVASYDRRCLHGASRIFSVRLVEEARPPKPLATIEVDPRRGAIVQARGFANAHPPAAAVKLMRAWAARERLSVEL